MYLIEIFCVCPPFSQWRTASASYETCPIMCTKKYQERSGFRSPMPIIWWGQWGTRRRRMSLTVLEGKDPKVGRPSLLAVLFQFGLLWLKTLIFISDVCNTTIIPFLRLIHLLTDKSKPMCGDVYCIWVSLEIQKIPVIKILIYSIWDCLS